MGVPSLIPTKTLPTKIRALWYAASITSSLWFLYWICYDVFVWNKLPTQVRPQNYVGLTIFITLTILGTQLEKTGISEKLMLLIEIVRKKTLTKNIQKVQQIQQIPEEKRLRSIGQTQQIQPAKDFETRTSKENAKIPPACTFYIGYLHERPKSVEIPEKCLACEYVVICLSPTARTIKA
jgi:hypothetical protein